LTSCAGSIPAATIKRGAGTLREQTCRRRSAQACDAKSRNVSTVPLRATCQHRPPSPLEPRGGSSHCHDLSMLEVDAERGCGAGLPSAWCATTRSMRGVQAIRFLSTCGSTDLPKPPLIFARAPTEKRSRQETSTQLRRSSVLSATRRATCGAVAGRSCWLRSLSPRVANQSSVEVVAKLRVGPDPFDDVSLAELKEIVRR